MVDLRDNLRAVRIGADLYLLPFASTGPAALGPGATFVRSARVLDRGKISGVINDAGVLWKRRFDSLRRIRHFTDANDQKHNTGMKEQRRQCGPGTSM